MGNLLLVLYVCGGWTLLLVLLGLLGRDKKQVACAASWGRFLVLVPAHNEEGVIQDTVEALQYAGCTVVVVADKCTDRTVSIARQAGAYVFEVLQGNKGRALNQYLDASDMPECFAAVGIVDCGTIVGASFAGEVSAALVEAQYVQGWLRSSGELSWVNAWYSWQYGLYHVSALGRDLLRLPAMIGGTAFAWRSSEHVRFNDKCLVEDLDLSLRCHRARASMVYRDLVAWDEKPSSLKVSLIQRLRWSRGGWWLLFHGRFWTWRIDDMAAALCTLASMVWGVSLAAAIVLAPVQVVLCMVAYMIMGAAGLLKLNQLDRFRWSLIYSIPLMSILEGCISVVALFTWKAGSWVRTVHSSGPGLLEREWKESQGDRAVGA